MKISFDEDGLLNIEHENAAEKIALGWHSNKYGCSKQEHNGIVYHYPFRGEFTPPEPELNGTEKVAEALKQFANPPATTAQGIENRNIDAILDDVDISMPMDFFREHLDEYPFGHKGDREKAFKKLLLEIMRDSFKIGRDCGN